MTPLHVLVLGGAGFLGSNLCDRLIAEGHRVLAIDDFSTGSRANVAHLARSSRFDLEERDVTLPLDTRHKVDWIFNLASPASPVHYQTKPVKTTLTNVLGTLHALELAARSGARMLQASTSEVYGDPAVHPQPESYWGNVNSIGVRACYDEGKRCAEALAMDFVRCHGVDLRLVRIFNTYGPRMAMDDGRVVSNFIVQALRGERITVYGDGSQTRSFCYVDDLIEGFLRFMHHPSELGPLNLGNDCEFTVRDLALTVLALTGSRGRIEQQPLPPDDPKVRRPDLSKARRLLRYEPTVDLETGLLRTIEAFRASLPSGSGVRASAAPSGVGRRVQSGQRL
jgi:UDP-glucuronate decarboxylase